MTLDRETVERWLADSRADKPHIPDDQTEGYGWYQTSRFRNLAKDYLAAIELLRTWLADHDNEAWPYPARATREFFGLPPEKGDWD